MLIYVSERRGHHSASSGYDQLVKCFPDAGCISAHGLEAGHVTWLRIPAGLRSIPRATRDLGKALPGSVTWHILYGDQTRLCTILRALTPSARIFVTLHQPSWFLQEINPDLGSFNAADVILTVSEHQAEGIRELGLAPRVEPVAYGIWTAAFGPQGATVNGKYVLVVGEHLRDWKFLVAMCRLLARRGVNFRMVIPARCHGYFADLARVYFEPRLSEHELALRYQRAAFLLLPLIDTTGNSAALEAAASGCPVLTNRLPSTLEYLSDAASYFPTGDLRACAEAAGRLLGTRTEPRSQLAARLLQRAQHFSLPGRVAALHRAAYCRV